MIDRYIYEKFESVEDLPVSEEVLGAYIEGNLSAVEAGAVSDMIWEDGYLENIVEDVRMLPDVSADEYGDIPAADDIILPDVGDAGNDNSYYLTEDTDDVTGSWYLAQGEPELYGDDQVGYDDEEEDFSEDFTGGYDSDDNYGYGGDSQDDDSCDFDGVSFD